MTLLKRQKSLICTATEDKLGVQWVKVRFKGATTRWTTFGQLLAYLH